MTTLARSRTAAPGTTAAVEGIAARGRRVARRGLWGLSRIARLITAGVVGLILIGIALVALEANRENMIVDGLLDGAGWLAGPFDNMFTLDGRKETLAVNYGLSALVYALAGGLIARFLRPR
jgi:hypothetical protein